ncbi:hypothetical protein MJO28_016048 [Puccinia striiformis f. sp. tritici]|uniref:Uncharacterized protein n=1 Tax=Puccinia striiformis f. sp. tritici TaxID=168172 RepID=A0ACC0DQG6_9BASI|nr:hypothetical protein MJO28_016048 [Puccinia striiformis f. sp. tritici]
MTQSKNKKAPPQPLPPTSSPNKPPAGSNIDVCESQSDIVPATPSILQATRIPNRATVRTNEASPADT